MKSRDRQDAIRDKRAAVEAAEQHGEIADSMDVRARLIGEMQRGEKTLAQIQAELAQIKRDAKRNGKTTRSAVYNRG